MSKLKHEAELVTHALRVGAVYAKKRGVGVVSGVVKDLLAGLLGRSSGTLLAALFIFHVEAPHTFSALTRLMFLCFFPDFFRPSP